MTQAWSAHTTMMSSQRTDLQSPPADIAQSAVCAWQCLAERLSPIIGERGFQVLRFSPHGTAFLTDAIIVQRYIEVESCLKRIMAVVKVRGSAHSDELHLFEITGDGIVIGEPLTQYQGLLSGQPALQSKTHASDAEETRR